MASLVFLEGFEGRHVPNGSGGVFESAAGGSFVAGRWGGYAFAANNCNTALNLGVSQTEILIGCSAQRNASNLHADWFLLQASSGVNVAGFGFSGGYIGNGSSLVVRPFTVVPLGSAWNTFEFKLVYGTSGSAEIRIDGVTQMTYTGSTTVSGVTGNTFDKIRWNAPSNNYGGIIDDLWVEAGAGCTFRGDRRIISLAPTSDVATGWTPTGGGAHYTQVNDPLTLTTYVSSAAASAATDTFGVADVSGVGTVEAVGVHAFARRSDTGIANLTLKCNATSSASIPVTQGPSAWQPARAVFSTNDGAGWTVAGVNASTAGLVAS